jgi:hypothetical protein
MSDHSRFGFGGTWIFWLVSSMVIVVAQQRVLCQLIRDLALWQQQLRLCCSVCLIFFY